MNMNEHQNLFYLYNFSSLSPLKLICSPVCTIIMTVSALLVRFRVKHNLIGRKFFFYY